MRDFFRDGNGFFSMMRLMVFVGLIMGCIGFVCGLIGFFYALSAAGTIVTVSAALIGAGEAMKFLQKRVEES